VMAEAPAAAPEVPSGPSPFEQKAPYYAKRIQLFEVYFAREGDKVSTLTLTLTLRSLTPYSPDTRSHSFSH